METIRRIILVITVLIIAGWAFYSAWQYVLTVQNNATCNTPTGTQFHEDLFEYVIMSLVRIAVIIVLALPGYLYSLCPLPKEFSDILIITGFGGGIYLILRLGSNNSPFSIFTSESSDSSSSDSYSGSSNSDEYNSYTASKSNGQSTEWKNNSENGCPDCDGPDTGFFTFDKGNGKCKKCHGTGNHLGLDDVFTDLVTLGTVEPDLTCDECSGNGKCQTCGGSGYV